MGWQVQVWTTGVWVAVSRVLEIEFQRGFSNDDERVAPPATGTVVLDNSTGEYSPVDGQYRVSASHPLGIYARIRILHDNEQMFVGHVTEIAPAPGRFGEQVVRVSIADALEKLNRFMAELPPYQDITIADAAQRIAGVALGGEAASMYVQFGGIIPANSWIEVGGVRYTFVDTPSAAYQVARRGGGGSNCAEALVAAILQDGQNASLYGAGTERHPLVNAYQWLPPASDEIITIEANAPGAWGNSIALSTNAPSDIILGGSTLTGGTDVLVADSDTLTLDRFAPIERGDVLSLLNGLLDAEYGRLYCDRTGQITLRNRLWYYKRCNGSPVLTEDSALDMRVRPAGSRLVTRARVTYRNASEPISGELARADSVLSVPGYASTSLVQERWNATDARSQTSGVQTFSLSYNRYGGEQLVPTKVVNPVPYTDYTVTDSKQSGGGYDYTGGKRLRLSVAIASGSVQVTAHNTASGSLYIHNLRVRGEGYVRQPEQEVVMERNVASFGLLEQSHQIPHAVAQACTQAESICGAILHRYSEPYVELESVTLDGRAVAGWETIDIGDLVAITDALIGSYRAIVMGVGVRASLATGEQQVTLALSDTHNLVYWLLGTSQLGTGTRLAF